MNTSAAFCLWALGAGSVWGSGKRHSTPGGREAMSNIPIAGFGMLHADEFTICTSNDHAVEHNGNPTKTRTGVEAQSTKQKRHDTGELSPQSDGRKTRQSRQSPRQFYVGSSREQPKAATSKAQVLIRPPKHRPALNRPATKRRA